MLTADMLGAVPYSSLNGIRSEHTVTLAVGQDFLPQNTGFSCIFHAIFKSMLFHNTVAMASQIIYLFYIVR
jgi:hypothetical protein